MVAWRDRRDSRDARVLRRAGRHAPSHDARAAIGRDRQLLSSTRAAQPRDSSGGPNKIERIRGAWETIFSASTRRPRHDDSAAEVV
jgi:hypothetical protein